MHVQYSSYGSALEVTIKLIDSISLQKMKITHSDIVNCMDSVVIYKVTDENPGDFTRCIASSVMFLTYDKNIIKLGILVFYLSNTVVTFYQLKS